MMNTILYIHGYGSTGEAMKARLLREMYPEAQVLSPTLDYDHIPPFDILRELQTFIDAHLPELIVGSSMGGYYALCCTQFFSGPVWCINPVRDIRKTLRCIIPEEVKSTPLAQTMLHEYERFDDEVFRHLHPADGQLRFALSTDDELLGDHHALLTLFPNHGAVVWKDHCGHRFLRFTELKDVIVSP